ncbi:MAG TPA: hypothetical protein VFW98_02950 [Gemmatimonadaceae bacterium]|nr:hypothetical protein [Gemmatimonadaceae bacterium]
MDRHLLPDEIDQLLDGEVGFGTAPLKAHVRRCAACRAELDDALMVVHTIEQLPHIEPSPLFASRVMAQVRVFVPWHVALADTVRARVPRSRAARVVAFSGASVIAVLLTVATLWIATRLDAVIFAANLVVGRVRSDALALLSSAVTTIFGAPATQMLRTNGVVGLSVALLALLLSAAVAARALRALTAGARRR